MRILHFFSHRKGLLLNIIIVLYSWLVSSFVAQHFRDIVIHKQSNALFGIFMAVVILFDTLGHDIKIRAVRDAYSVTMTGTRKFFATIVWIFRLMIQFMAHTSVFASFGLKVEDAAPLWFKVVFMIDVLFLFSMVSYQVFLLPSEGSGMLKKTKPIWGDIFLMISIPVFLCAFIDGLLGFGGVADRHEQPLMLVVATVCFVLFFILPIRWVYVWEEYEQQQSWPERIGVIFSTLATGFVVLYPIFKMKNWL